MENLTHLAPCLPLEDVLSLGPEAFPSVLTHGIDTGDVWRVTQRNPADKEAAAPPLCLQTGRSEPHPKNVPAALPLTQLPHQGLTCDLQGNASL